MEKIVLKNGLTVALEKLDFVRSAAIHVFVGCGNSNENEQNVGMSHFIEHMVFKGTQTQSSRDILQKTDLMGGGINAFTAKEHTCFYARTLDYHVPKMLDIICDMICYPLLSEQDIEVEKGVVLEEIRMYEDTPEELCIDKLNEVCWENSHLAYNILGTRETVNNFKSEQLREFLKKYYVPERTVISVCGSFDRREVLAVIEKYFSQQPNSKNPIHIKKPVFSGGISLLDRPTEQTHVSFCFEGDSITAEDRYAALIFSTIAGGSQSSRLYLRIREELGLAYNVFSYNSNYRNCGSFSVSAALAPENQHKFLQESLEILGAMRRDITDDEIYRTKEQYKSSLVMSTESVVGISASMGRQLLYNGEYVDVNGIIDKIDSVTKEEVLRVSRKTADPKKIALSVVGTPLKEDRYKEIIENYCLLCEKMVY